LLRIFSDQGAAAGLSRFAEMQRTAPGTVDAESVDELADLLIGRGKAAEAAALLSQSAGATPSAKSYGSLGNAWLAAGELERALESYEAATKLDPSSPRTDEIRWIREGIAMKKSPVTLSPDVLRRFAGDYGPRHIRLEGGVLTYTRTSRTQVFRLVPAKADTFFVEGRGNLRIQFTTDPAGRATKITILDPEGPQDSSPRDP
jgi:tetratricopeptide (TPR) repeat protein